MNMKKAFGWSVVIVAGLVFAYGSLFTHDSGKGAAASGSAQITIGQSPSEAQVVRAAAGASICTDSGYLVHNRIDGSKETIYDCTMPSGSWRCVTYSDGIANDSTDYVRLLFSTTLGTSKPACLTG